MRMDPGNGRGTLRAGSPWRGLGRALVAALRVLVATGLRAPRCDRVRA
jgi:hypothetical protein